MRLAAISVLAAFVAGSPRARAEFDAKRTFLKGLEEKSEAQATDFEYPFLVAETARLLPKSAAVASRELIALLKRASLPFRPHFGKSGIPAEKIRGDHIVLPEVVRTGKQLDAIRTCNHHKCLMKLTQAEMKLMEASTDRVNSFRDLLAARLRLYLLENELKGYEYRRSDTDFQAKMLAVLPFLKTPYPTSLEFMRSGFWKGKPAPSTFKGSFLRQELVNIVHDKLQPIWRIGEVLEFREKDATVLFEVFPYSDHYLDSSFRVYEVLPRGQKSVVILTDVMEIDELTKSGVIRMLYRGKMEEAVSAVEHDELAELK